MNNDDEASVRRSAGRFDRGAAGRAGLIIGVFALTLAAVPAWSQGSAAEEGAPAAASEDENWRDVSAYPFPAIGATVQSMQFLAMALQLREYCADARIPDEFVRERLARFSQLTGREETCPRLLDY